jgi:cell division protein FtsZ
MGAPERASSKHTTNLLGKRDRMHSDLSKIGEYRAAVICVGGAGCNIASKLVDRLCKADVVAVNSDSKSLADIESDYKFVVEDVSTVEDQIRAFIRNYDFIYIVSAMGGNTGTAVSAEIAAICAVEKVETTALAIMPYSFEDRQLAAFEGFRNLHSKCPTAGKFEMDCMLERKDVKFSEVMEVADDMICNYVEETVNELPIVSRRVPPTDAEALVGIGCRSATS